MFQTTFVQQVLSDIHESLNQNTNSEHLAMGDGTDTYDKETNCCWPFNPLMTDSYKSCPSFKLENEHDVNGNGYTFGKVGFYCAEVLV
jgi:hypothetical protein